MLTVYDIQERALNGPIMKEKEYDLKLSKTVRQLIKDYSIAYHPEEVIPDDKTADAVFNAGMDLILKMGLYHLQTNRVIQFTKEEIMEMIENSPREVTFGEGKDTVTIKERVLEDERSPVRIPGPAGMPMSDEMFIPLMQSIAQEETAQGIVSGTLMSVGDIGSRAGYPSEIYCAMHEAQWTREAARRAGKPGMFCLIPAGPLTCTGAISTFFPAGYNENVISMVVLGINELKTDWEQLKYVTYASHHGLKMTTAYMPVLGGWTGGPEGCAVNDVALNLALSTFTRSQLILPCSVDFKGRMTSRKCKWTDNAFTVATGRNWPVPVASLVFGIAGPCTEQALMEVAACGLVVTVAGAEANWGVGSSSGVEIDKSTGMEARICGETMIAATGMKREEANRIFDKIYSKYEEMQEPGKIPKGKTFEECYDVKKVKPTQEYLDVFARAKTELAHLGIKYRY